MLRKYGLDHDSAMRIASSRKKYWRLSSTHEVHRALQQNVSASGVIITNPTRRDGLRKILNRRVRNRTLGGERTNNQVMIILLLICPKRADDILKASMEYQSTDYKRRYISWKTMIAMK